MQQGNSLSKITIPALFLGVSILGAAFVYQSTDTPIKPFFDTLPQKASYLYAPGLMGSELIMGRYCPRFTAQTGEKISWARGGHVIGQPHTAVTFPEINVKKPTCFTLHPITALINEVRQDLYPLAQQFLKDMYGVVVEDNPASSKTVANYSFHLGRANIGQRADIRALNKAYHAHIKKYPGTAVILYGDSRGAATIFNFIARYQPQEVKAAVLEGIFDDVNHIIKHFLYMKKEEKTERRLRKILSFVMGSYRDKGICPRHCLDSMTNEIPLLFVTSLYDGIVPAPCTFYLYKALKDRGFTKIHLLVLKQASHIGYMLDNIVDASQYENVVHAFYKQYNLPHNSAKAEQGKEAFALTQPTAQELDARYVLPVCQLCK